MKLYLPVLVVLVVATSPVFAQSLRLQDCVPLSEDLAAQSQSEYLYGGRPDNHDPAALYSRRAYVISYDAEHKVPVWGAWRASKEFLGPPSREGKWYDYRTDPEADTVASDDYIGWRDSPSNLVRGHIVPYFISGGDRDGDGVRAVREESLAVADSFDACTVFEVNSMINIAPQYHDAFNGVDGIWYALETDVRRMIRNRNREFKIMAGTAFLDDIAIEVIGNMEDEESDWNIAIPHGFWKIVIDPNTEEAIGFLFDHSADLDEGCSLDTMRPSNCVVPVESIEAVTGLSFFWEVNEQTATTLRQSSTREVWMSWLQR